MSSRLRFMGFLTLPLLSALSPLILLPVVARVGGPSGWASFATSQAIGTAAGVLISYGWYIVGPPRVVASAAGEHAAIYSESLRSKLAISIVLLPSSSVLAAYFATEDHVSMAVSTCIASAVLQGFTFTWLQVGRGDPKPIAMYETLPRLAATCVAVAVTIWSANLFYYGIIMTVVSVSSLALYHKKTFGRVLVFLVPPAHTTSTALRLGFPAAIVATVSLGFSSLPLPLISATQSLLETSQFASAQKLYVYGLIVITATMDAVQAWVLRGNIADRHKKAAKVSFGMGLIGVFGALVLVVGGTFLTSLLFGSDVSSPQAVNMGFAIAYLASSMATVAVRLVLIPEGLSRIVLRNNVLAVLVGVALMSLGASTLGPVGVGFGLGVGQAVYCFLNWLSVIRHRRQ